MDHEVVPRPCQICDWLLNSSLDKFGFHQRKNVKVTMEFKILKKHISRPTLSADMVQKVLWWERQKRCSNRKRQGPMAEKWCYKFFIMKCIWGREGEDKRRQENIWSNLIFFFPKTVLFVHIVIELAHSLLVHGHSSWSTFGSHLVRGYKAL